MRFESYAKLKEAMTKDSETHDWRTLGAMYNASAAMAWRIVKEQGYEPMRAETRRALGIPVLVKADPCPTCKTKAHGYDCATHQPAPLPKPKKPTRKRYRVDLTAERDRLEILANARGITVRELILENVLC